MANEMTLDLITQIVTLRRLDGRCYRKMKHYCYFKQKFELIKMNHLFRGKTKPKKHYITREAQP